MLYMRLKTGCVLCLQKKLCPAVCGLLVLLKSEVNSEEPPDRPPERVLYLRLEQTPAWAQQDFTQKQDAYARFACIFLCRKQERDSGVCVCLVSLL